MEGEEERGFRDDDAIGRSKDLLVHGGYCVYRLHRNAAGESPALFLRRE